MAAFDTGGPVSSIVPLDSQRNRSARALEVAIRGHQERLARFRQDGNLPAASATGQTMGQLNEQLG
jgi:hypothetical protein